jgi:hypothetical protein
LLAPASPRPSSVSAEVRSPPSLARCRGLLSCTAAKELLRSLAAYHSNEEGLPLQVLECLPQPSVYGVHQRRAGHSGGDDAALARRNPARRLRRTSNVRDMGPRCARRSKSTAAWFCTAGDRSACQQSMSRQRRAIGMRFEAGGRRGALRIEFQRTGQNVCTQRTSPGADASLAAHAVEKNSIKGYSFLSRLTVHAEKRRALTSPGAASRAAVCR